MAKIDRYDGNVEAFAADSLGTERTIFGDTAQSNTLDGNITENFLRGWGIVGVNENPTKQDFNGLAFTLGQLISYLHQRGVPEWNTDQEYYEGSVVTTIDGIYKLKAGGDGTVDPDTDAGANWEAAATRTEVEDRVIRVTSIAAMEAYSAPAGYVFSLNSGKRSGDFDVIAGAAPVTDTLNGIYIALANGNHAKRRYFGKAYAKWFGISNDGSNAAPDLMIALLVAKHIVLSAGSAYGVSASSNTTGIIFLDDQVLEFEKGASIQAINGNSAAYRILNIVDVSNVTLINPVVVGDRATNSATGEHGNCINLLNATGTRVYGGKVTDAFGDGFYVGADSTDTKIYDLEARNNRRQGLSLTSANGFRAYRCGFYDTNGTAPEFGVDIETNDAPSLLKDIKFVDCISGGNASRIGFGVANVAQDDFIDVEFVNCSTTDGDTFQVADVDGEGVIKYTGCTSIDANGTGFKVKRSSINVMGSVTVIDPNRGGSTSLNSVNSAGAYFLEPVTNVDVDLTVTEIVQLDNPVLSAFTTSSSGITDCKVRMITNLPRDRSINIIGLPTSLDLSVSGDREFSFGGNVSLGNVVRDNLIRYTIMTNENQAYTLNHVFGSESDFEGNFLGFKSYRDETCSIQLATNTTEGFNKYVATAAGAFIKFKYNRGVWQITDRIGTWTGSVV